MMREKISGALKKVVVKPLGWAGFSLQRIRSQQKQPYSLAGFLRSRDINVIIDVGANRGQFADNVFKQGFRGRIISFEPILELANDLEQGARRRSNWEIRPFALGESGGEALLNVSASDDFSSFKEHARESEDIFDGIATKHTQRAAVRRLDETDIGLCSASRIFIKSDTQGYDREVLNGATRILPQVLGIQVEVPIHQLYKDTWTFSEAVCHLGKIGFVPAQFWPVTTFPDDPASAVELDCIFRRTAHY
jgi:FkbM family methyltransferase